MLKQLQEVLIQKEKQLSDGPIHSSMRVLTELFIVAINTTQENLKNIVDTQSTDIQPTISLPNSIFDELLKALYYEIYNRNLIHQYEELYTETNLGKVLIQQFDPYGINYDRDPRHMHRMCLLVLLEKLQILRSHYMSIRNL